ncbi:MAG: hypothetical protein QW735_02255 [archaeon]
MISGKKYFFYIYDVAQEINLQKIEKIFKKSPALFEFSYSRLMPLYVKLEPAPLEIILKRKIGQKECKVIIHIYSIGVISICFVMDFSGSEKEIMALVDEGEIKSNAEHLLQSTIDMIKDALEKPTSETFYEDYKVLVLKELDLPANEFIKKHKKEIAAFLREETNPEELSEDEIKRAFEVAFSYYSNDFCLPGYVNSFVIEPGNEKDIITIFEIANIQLLEFRFYSNLLDKLIDKAYEDLRKIRNSKFGIGSIPWQEIASLKLEITEMIENVLNYSKFTGDWHTARVYNATVKKLHIDELREEIKRKLDVLTELYAVATQNIEAKRANFLELLIVILILIEILLFFFK